MALITTIGSKLANSFDTVAEADAYLSAIGIYNLTAWNALATSAKEIRLIYAARILTSRFIWAGWPVYKNQALPFPRWFSSDDSIVIPEEIKMVQAYISYVIVHKRFVEISNPADGPLNSPDIQSIGVFGISMSAAAAPVQAADSSILEEMTRTEHMHIYLLLEPYSGEGAMCIPGPEGPPLLDEVA